MLSPNNYEWQDQCYWGWENVASVYDILCYQTYMEKYWKATKAGEYMRDAHIYASI